MGKIKVRAFRADGDRKKLAGIHGGGVDKECMLKKYRHGDIFYISDEPLLDASGNPIPNTLREFSDAHRKPNPAKLIRRGWMELLDQNNQPITPPYPEHLFRRPEQPKPAEVATVQLAAVPADPKPEPVAAPSRKSRKVIS